jgi:hypothetical protein
MTPHARSQSLRSVRRVILWMGILGLLLPVSLSWTAAVGDQVTLHARNRAGVPLHREPRGTQDFQRAPDGTKAAVTALTQDGRWLKVRASIIAPGVVHRQLRHGRLPCAPT